MSDFLKDVDVAQPVAPSKPRRPSFIWLIPLLALAISAAVVWNNYASRGPLITVTFKSAAGINPGTTELRIRDLRIGVVEAVNFSGNMATVEAHIRLDKSIAPYVDKDAQFWLVEPEVTARGVTGIGTLLSGVYIAANWDGSQGEAVERFVALETAPLRLFGEEGTRIVLQARSGNQFAAGAPILASGIDVGRIGLATLSHSGNAVTMEAFVRKPYDARLTTNSRFWDTSGISINLGAQGLAVKVDSLAALLEGGVSFETAVTGGRAIADGHVFKVFSSEGEARADAFEAGSDPDVAASILLDGNVSGLGLGTIVRFKGIKVGEVDDFVGVAADEGSEETVKLRVDLRLSPGPLGLPKNLTKETLRDALEERVENGLRARVATEGLFAQNLVLELVQLASAPAAEVSVDPDGRLLLPTAPAVLPDAGAGVSDLVKRISDLPIEELMSSATQALAGISRLTGTAEGLLATESVGRIPQTIEQTLEDVRRVVAEIREGGAVDNMNATLRSADSALKSIAAAASTLPALTKRLDVAANGLQATIAGYDSQSRFYQDVRKVLRDISSTSEALQSLARSIERNPSSLIRGRR